MEENNYGGFDYDFHETLNQGLKYGEGMKYRDKQQEHEYGQQVALQLQSQEFAMDYEGKMEAMKKAGINPLTAAAGLAGASTPAISSVPSSAVGQGVNAVNAASEAVKTISGGAKDVVESVAQGTKLDPEKNQIIADTYLKYKEAGYNDEMAKGLAIANSYLPAEKFLGLVALSGQIRNLHGEYLNMMKDIDVKNERIKEIDQHIQEMGSTISLNEKLALESEKRALQIEAQTEETEWLNNKRKELDIDPRSPLEMNMFMSGVKYGPDDARYITGNKIVYDTSYNRFSGEFDVEPHNAEVKRLYDYRNKLMDYRSQLKEFVVGLKEQYSNGKVPKDKFDYLYNNSRHMLERLNKDIEDADDAWRSDDYIRGYHSQLEDMLQQGLPFGLGYLFSRGQRPVKVKGYSNYR